MATILEQLSYAFLGGTSEIVGYESGKARAIRYKFTTPDVGASKFSFSKKSIGLYDGTAANLRFYISPSPDLYDDLCADLTAGNSVTMTNSGGLYTATGADNSITLLPNTDYYLYIFPGTTTYCMYTWNYPSAITVTLDGAAGVVHIDTGSGWVTAIPYIDDGTKWQQAMPYEDNGSAWKPCV